MKSCPTLCDPMDCSLPGFSVQGIFQARALEWIAFSGIQHYCRFACVPSSTFAVLQSLSGVWLFATSRLQHAGLPCPSLIPRVHSNSWPLSQWYNLSHPLLTPSFAFNFPSISVFFQWVGSLYQVDKVLDLQLQHQSFQWIFRVDFLRMWPIWKQGLYRDNWVTMRPLEWGASLVTQMVKNPLAMQKTWVQSLGWEDPLKKEMATHSSILAWRIPWTEKPDWLQSKGSQRVRHDWVTNVAWLEYL